MRLAMGQLYARSIASPIEAHPRPPNQVSRTSAERAATVTLRTAERSRPVAGADLSQLGPVGCSPPRSARTRNARWSPLPLLPGVREALDSGTAVRDSHAVHDN